MEPVLCLHSSASNGRQWQRLAVALGSNYQVLTPNLIGYGNKTSAKLNRFSLDDEVDAVLRQIGDAAEPMHVVGHSYGGSVALRFAARYPERVATLTLYEPAQWLLLFEDGLDSDEAREIRELREVFRQQARSIFSRWFAAREFVSFWSGPDAWLQMRHAQKLKVLSVMPKVSAEWNAVFSSNASIGDGAQLTMPVHVLCGTQTKATARRTAELLAAKISTATLHWVDGLAHMGPLTHANIVNSLIIQNIDTTSRACRPIAA